MMGKPKSLVDKIQQDFPRTPSPIYTKTRAEELGLGMPPTVTLRTGQVLQPQPQSNRAHVLNERTLQQNTGRMTLVQPQPQQQLSPMYYPETTSLELGLQNLSLEVMSEIFFF
jgi:hypothetical protein